MYDLVSGDARIGRTNSYKTMNKKLFKILMVLAIVTATALSVSAHEIRLKNGDRLSGIVVSRDRDGVVLETQYAGRIRIAMEYIETIDGASGDKYFGSG